MAAINMDWAGIFSDVTTRGVFEAVAKPRTILFRDLKVDFPPEDVQRSLDRLKKANLIKEQTSAIQDFSTLYVTADGLSAAYAMNVPL
jgi:hypothetical protein